MRIPEEAKVPLLLGMCGLLVVLLLRAWLRRFFALRRGHRRQAVAAYGELKAVHLLRRAGYRVLDSQVRTRHRVKVDGRTERYELRADLIVERGGQRFVAEVKTGELAPNLQHGATRRQLLEYALAYPVTGVLLVDVPDGRVHRVEFGRPPGSHRRALTWLVIGTGLGFGLANVPAEWLPKLLP